MGRRRARVTIRKSGDLPPRNPSFGPSALSAAGTGAGHAGEANMHHPSRLYIQACLLVLSFLATIFMTAAPASAQHAALGGRVFDPTGRPVAGATIVVEGQAVTPWSTHADADGAFTVPSVPPGLYTIRISAPGLGAPAREVRVEPGASVHLDVTLRLTVVDERLVVTAVQVDQPLSHVPDSTTVIAGEELQARQQFTASQALRSVPGLVVQQNGGPGAVASLFTRGGESDYTLVLVDGIRANAFGGGMDLSQLPLADVDRIEVVRGPQSALYGADAIGGVVQIFTRSGGAPSVQGLVEGGSRAMLRAAGSTTGEHRGFRWQAGGDYFEEEGFTGQASNRDLVTNDDARWQQGAVTLGWRDAGGKDLQGTLRYMEADRGTPGPYGSDPAGRFDGVDRTSRNLTERWTGGVRWLQPWFGASSLVRQRTEVDVADYDLVFESAFPSEGESRRTHVRTQTDVAATSAVGLTGGVEWLGEQGGSTYITAGSAGEVPVKRSVLGLFAESRWQVSARLSVTAGVRGERLHRDAFPGDPFAFTPRPDFPAETLTSVNPKLAASWMVAGDPGTSRAWTRVHGAMGTGIRPPDAFEIAFTDNSGLKPERSRSADLGLAQVLAGGAMQLEATAFFNTYDDLIVSVGRSFAGASRWRTDNISNARARGAEFSAAWRRGGGLAVQATYTFLSTEILAVDGSPEAPPPYAVGDPLLRRPRHQGSMDASWTRDRAVAFVQVMLRGETLDAEPAWGPTGGLYSNPGYSVTNIGASFQVARGVMVQARVLNLLDRAYEEVLGYPAPRRTAYVGVRLAASR
jgi:outer membrane cobalamin receptor